MDGLNIRDSLIPPPVDQQTLAWAEVVEDFRYGCQLIYRQGPNDRLSGKFSARQTLGRLVGIIGVNIWAEKACIVGWGAISYRRERGCSM